MLNGWLCRFRVLWFQKVLESQPYTNHLDPCKRLYIVYADEDKRSFFKYEEDGKIITDFDDQGLTIREFDIPGSKPYFWHCVGSTCNRFSFGFRIEGMN